MDKINDGSAVNLSTGKLTSFIEFAKKTSNILGFNPKVEGTDSKPEGVFARGGDVSKQNELGFQYSIEFDDGIKKALTFFENKL
jgi:nucleoside-diphosphate-sugar epimerase